MTADHRATVAVLGGGPAGASAALELARRGIDTVLVEQTDGSGNPVGECLAPSANPLLRRLGLDDLLSPSLALPSYGNRSAWGGDGVPLDRDFLRDPHGHGWHLDRPAFNRALLDRADSAGVTVLRHHCITALDRIDQTWRLSAAAPAGNTTIHASLLIDTSGRRSLLARHQRMRRRTFDSQIAALAILRPVPHAAPLRDATTLIEAVARGWWYAALLPGGELAVAWFTDPDLLAEHTGWRAAEWWTQLHSTALIGPIVATHGYQPPQRVERFPAGSSLLTTPSGDGWIAAGDAAAAYDPLSSHGIGSALAGGQGAARAVAATLDGDAGAFAAYRDRLLADYTRYLYMRHAYYADEQRWPDVIFWNRRHATEPAPPS